MNLYNLIVESLDACRAEDLVSANNYCCTDMGYSYDEEIFTYYDLCEMMSYWKPEDIMDRMFYGYHYEEHGDEKAPFNPRAEYFGYNGYGNLVSYYSFDAKGIAKDTILDAIDESTDERHLLELCRLLNIEPDAEEDDDDD